MPTTRTISHKKMTTIRRMDTKRCFSLRSIEWKERSGRAKDIAVGADDAIWVVASTGLPHRWNGKYWSQIGSKVATRIAVQPDGRPWIVTASGELFRWHCVFWQQIGLPGQTKAQDVGAGASGRIAITTTDNQIFTFAKGSWKKQPGSAKRIDVGPSGQLWVVNKEGNVYEKVNDSTAWKHHSNAKPANDVGAGPEGSVYITGEKAAIFKLGKNGKFWNMGGSATQVSVGKGGRPFVVNKHNRIYWPVNTCVEEKKFEYYVDNKGSKTWYDAEATCKRWGGHLASISQSREKARIMNLMAIEGVNDKAAWVGGQHLQKKWQWSDESKVGYWPIAESQHAKGCTALSGRGADSHRGKMVSDACSEEKPFVCKRPIGGKPPGYIPGKQCPMFGRALPSRNTKGMEIIRQRKNVNWLSKLDKISFCNSKKAGKSFLSKLRFHFNNFDNHLYKAQIEGQVFLGCKSIKLNKKASGKVTYVKHFWNTLDGKKIATGFKVRFAGGQTVVIGHKGCAKCHVYENFYNKARTLIGFAVKSENGEAASTMRLIYNSCPAKVFEHDTSGIRRGKQCKNENEISWVKRTMGQNASDIAVDGSKNVYISGTDGKVYKSTNNKTWSKQVGIKDSKRIAVTPKGTVFTVTNNGTVKSLAKKDSAWKSYAMKAIDVGAGANG